MKVLPWVLVTLLLVVCVAAWFRPFKSLPAEVIRDTVMVIDTVKDTVPKPYRVTVVRTDTFYLPILVGDSSGADSVFVALPIEQKEYRDSMYTAWVSGYQAKLDSIEIYNKVQTIYVRKQVKKKRWGLGIQAGYGYPDGWYIGAGISYNIFQW